MCTTPLEGPNAGWIIEALEQAMQKHGTPKHIISDQAKIFVGDAFAGLLKQWNIKPRLGAVPPGPACYRPQAALVADSAPTRQSHPRLTDTVGPFCMPISSPAYLRSDNTSQSTGEAVKRFLKELDVDTLFIEPGSPCENGYIESFHSRMRDELLNGELFLHLMG